MENKLSKLIEEYKKRTAKECYKFNIIEKTPDILDDKLGGNPYLPKGEEYPLDKNGDAMPLLMQVNLKNIDLEGWPKTGILEVFVDKELEWPCQYVVKYFEEGLEYQTEFPKIDLDYFIIDSPMKIKLEKDICHMPISDYRSNDILCEISNELFQTEIKNSMELDKIVDNDDWIIELMDNISNPEGTVGGYADFTQADPRDNNLKDKDECLIKLDSCLDNRLCIGDAGILFVLISKKDIENCNFDNAIVDWDCC